MKRILSITLLALFLFNFCGYYCIEFLMRSEIRAEMMREMEEGTPELLELEKNDPDLVWLDEHEITYKGKLYDIREVVESGSKLRIYCYHDHKEQLLEEDLEKHVAEHNEDLSKTKSKVKFLLKYFPLYFPCPAVEFAFAGEINANRSTMVFIQPGQIMSDVLVPPPQKA